MVKFIIPGVYEHAELNLKLLDLMREHPELFRDNVEIYSCYGNFQHCIFDGGRIFNEFKQTTLEEINYYVNEYNKRGVRVRLVCTNNQLKETDYYDRFGNIVLDVCHNGFNEVTIADENFAKYVKEHYPNYKFISSTTKCITSPEKFKKELENNDYMVCLDYNLNKNKEMLFSLPQEEKDKCEFLVNAICGPGCAFRKEHYRLNSIYNINYGLKYQMEHCRIQTSSLHPTAQHYKNNFMPEQIFEEYEPNGFTYFKIEGRTWPDIELICTYANYLVKPEYKLFFIFCMSS